MAWSDFPDNGSRGALDDRTSHDEALPTNEAGRSRYAVLFCRLETCVAERAGMAIGNSWQATMRMALDACAGDEKPLHVNSASGSGELRWLEPGPRWRRGGSDLAERRLGVRYSYDFPI